MGTAEIPPRNAIAAHDPVAWHDDRKRIVRTGPPHGPGRARMAQKSRNLAIRRSTAVRNGKQSQPDRLAELRRRRSQGKRKNTQPPRNPRIKLPERLDKYGLGVTEHPLLAGDVPEKQPRDNLIAPDDADRAYGRPPDGVNRMKTMHTGSNPMTRKSVPASRTCVSGNRDRMVSCG